MKNTFIWKRTAVIAVMLVCSLGLVLFSASAAAMGEGKATVSRSDVVFDEGNIVLSFGALTDTHNNSVNTQKALNYINSYSTRPVDAFIITGDLVDGRVYYGTTNEVPAVKKLFESALTDSQHIFFCLGNHDSNGGSDAAYFFDNLGERFYTADIEGSLDYARESGNRHGVIGGYHFIALENAYSASGKASLSAETKTWFAGELKNIVEDPAYKGEYIFILTHTSQENTVLDSESSRLTELDALLADYPQAVVMSGHTHSTLYDDRSIHQDTYTSLHLGAVHYQAFYGGFYQMMASPNYILANKPNGTTSESYSYPTGCLVELDAQGNMRITRMDFAKGAVIKEPWVIPAPSQDGAHLSYYTDARETTNTAPAFQKDAKVTVEKVSDDTLRVTVDRAQDDDLVWYYNVEIYNGSGSYAIKTVKSLSDFYKYPGGEPDTYSVDITGLTLDIYESYIVSVEAYDAYGAKSSRLTYTIKGVSVAEGKAAEALDEAIRALPAEPALADEAKIRELRAAYEALNSVQKAMVKSLDLLNAAEKGLERFYTPLPDSDHYLTNAGLTGDVMDGLTVTELPGGGTHWAWSNAAMLTRMGIAQAINLDGTHLAIENLKLGSFGKLGLLISDTPNSQYKGGESLLILIDFTYGKVTVYPGAGDAIYTGDAAKAENLGDAFDIRFTKTADGDFLLAIGTAEMTVPGYAIAQVKGLTDTESCYLTLSAWDGGTSLEMDVISVHGGDEECQSLVKVLDILQLGDYDRAYAAEQGDDTTLSVNAAYSTDPGEYALIYSWYKLESPEDTVGTLVSADESYALPSDLEVGTHYYKCVVTSAHSAVVAAESDVITVTVSEASRGFFGMLLAFFKWLLEMVTAYFTVFFA